jgi:hypothetical protein
MRRLALGLVLASLVAGCEGRISGLIDSGSSGGGSSGGGSSGGGSSGGGSSGGGSSGGGSSGGGGGASANSAACQVSRTALTRLNTAEIDATLATVIGDQTAPARFFPADVISSLRFDNDASQLAIAPELVQGIEGAMGAVVNQAWSRDAAGGATPAVRLCTPGGSVTESACARTILAGVARKAWRRPATSDEIASLVSVYDATRADGDDFETAVKLGLQAVLDSPNFLFRTEAQVPDAKAASSHAMAARLSYFLWGTSPDAELAALADSGELTRSEVLDAQITRMLADAKGASLKKRFVAQWFNTRNVSGVALDPGLFPGLTPDVTQGMQKQIDAYLDEFLFGDRDALDMLDAPVTYVDGPLARFLGMTPTSENLTRVELPPGDLRAGLLGKSGPLVVTSKPTATNVPRRANWVFQRLLCTPMDPPAGAVVPPLPDASTAAPTTRERLDALTAPVACSACHQIIGPVGYSLEIFAADSRHRTQENGATIDTSGTFNGAAFDDVTGFVKLLKADPRVEACMVQQTLSFALARPATKTGDDATAAAALQAAFEAKGRRFTTLVSSVAKTAALACKP